MSDSSHTATRQSEASLAAAEVRRATSAPTSPKQRSAEATATPEETLELARRVAENLRKESAIARLKECDEHLASLLSQAAASLSALVSAASNSERNLAADGGGIGSLLGGADDAQARADEEELKTSAARVKAFEERAGEWFATLNDVQNSLRTAVATLRHDSRAALSANANFASASARAEAGSALRGHDLPLRGAFAAGAATSSSSATPSETDDESYSNGDAELSIGGLRLQHRSWAQLNEALASLALSASSSSLDDTSSEETPRASSPTRSFASSASTTRRPALTSRPSTTSTATFRLAERQTSEDSRLLGALLGFLPTQTQAQMSPTNAASALKAPRRSSVSQETSLRA